MESTSATGPRVRAPDAKLAAFVDHYWRGLGNRERSYDILPDGCVDVVLHVQGTDARLWAFGTSSRFKREAIEPGDYLGIRFRPGMARFFLDVPADELTDRREPLGREFLFRANDLSCDLGSDQDFERLDRDLSECLARRDPRLSAIDIAIRRIEASHGGVRIDAMAADLGRSRRQLEREFLRTVGLSPKHFAVVSRFRHAAARLASRPRDSLATIAADAGYADQSHMVRDFRQLAGAPPSHWPGRVAFVQDA